MVSETRKVVSEIQAILEANKDLDEVSVGKVDPLTSETDSASVYISVESVVLEAERNSTLTDGYDRRMMASLYCNSNCSNDPFAIYDMIDSVERSLLKDSALWKTVVDRDIVMVEFDRQEFLPMRQAIMLVELKYRVSCNI